MSKAWGGAGAWALEAERAEAEERELAAAAGEDVAAATANPLLAGEPAQSFPSLREAAATKSKKKNKPVSLAQFQTSAAPSPGPFGGRRESLVASKGLTPDEILRLPTGPRERSQEELEHGRLGGGFRSYGGGTGGPRGGFPNRRSDDADGSWGAGSGRRGYGGFEDETRRGGSDIDQPSRADEVDNWGAGKKPMMIDSGGRQDRYGSLGTDSSSRADEVDNWASSKKPLPTRYSNFGSGYNDARAPSDSDRWGRGRDESVPTNGERRKLVLDPPKREIVPSSDPPKREIVPSSDPPKREIVPSSDPPKREIVPSSEPVRNRPSPFGAARPREDVLTEKGVDWRKIDSEIDVKKSSRPTSSHSSRPSTAQSGRPGSPGAQTTPLVEPAEIAPKYKPKVNPFGAAKPREVVLQEKGMDWSKINQDMEHPSINRPETEREIELKNDINLLKELAEEAEGDDLNRIKGNLTIIEGELEVLTRELDDKVKFGQKAIGNVRPGSAASRNDASSTRPTSQSSMTEEHRNEYVERPRSLGGPADIWSERPRSHGGSADVWSRPMDDRRGGFQGGREKSFFENRNMDRSGSREGW